MARFRFPSARSLLVCGLLSAGMIVSALPAAETERVDIVPGQSQRTVTLRDRLVVGLQARLKSEVEFVEEVVERVQAGQLPRRMVDQTFFWARERSGAQRGRQSLRPIIYFRPVMTARAKKIGVEL